MKKEATTCTYCGHSGWHATSCPVVRFPRTETKKERGVKEVVAVLFLAALLPSLLLTAGFCVGLVEG